VDDVSGILKKIAFVSTSDRHKLDELVGMAGMLWLELCSQRYRLRVVLPNDVEDVIMREIKAWGLIKLVFKPGLLRSGNVEGQNLSREDYVGGWRGQNFEYHPK
jgi:hypothetical protein